MHQILSEVPSTNSQAGPSKKYEQKSYLAKSDGIFKIARSSAKPQLDNTPGLLGFPKFLHYFPGFFAQNLIFDYF